MHQHHEDAFDRLRGTATLSGEALRRWRSAELAIAGAGLVGGHFVLEAARSGAHCTVFDPGIGELANTRTQSVEAGRAKVETLARMCDAFAPGSVRAHEMDILAAGEGWFESASLIVDCTDDPSLSFPLARLSNGWGVPLLRLAVDGSGQREMGRVMVSHGSGGHACGICGASWREAFDPGPRVPCLGPRGEAPATYAGNAVAMAVAAMGLLVAQRLIGGHGADRVLNREFIVDLDQPQILPMRLKRSDDCFTEHRRWAPVRLGRPVEEITIRELTGRAVEELARHRPDASPTPTPETVRVGLPALPFQPSLVCTACGESEFDVSTSILTCTCPRCGEAMQRRRDVTMESLTLDEAEALAIADRTCGSLGFPSGALVRAQAAGIPSIQLLLS